MGIYWLIAIFLYMRTQYSMNNQLIDHSDSLLITIRNLILAKFIKYIKLYFTLLMLKKEKIKLDQFKEFVFKSYSFFLIFLLYDIYNIHCDQ